RRRREDDEYGDERRRLRHHTPPGEVQAIAVMALVGGIFAILLALGLGAGSGGVCCLWPGTYYSLVVGILATIKGANLLGQQARRQAPPRGTAIMMIINIINGDVLNLAMGIVILVLLSNREVERYYRG